MTYREFIHQWDANAPKGVTTMLNTVDQGFQPEIIDTLIEQGLPFSSLFVHRAASLSWSREPRRCVETAFALRQDHLMVELIAAWGATGRRAAASMGTKHLTGTSTLCLERRIHRLWIRKNRARSACFGSNYERLLDLKAEIRSR